MKKSQIDSGQIDKYKKKNKVYTSPYVGQINNYLHSIKPYAKKCQQRFSNL